MKTLNEDTSFKVSLKTLGGIAAGIAAASLGMFGLWTWCATGTSD